MILAIEGPDRVGKTTVFEELRLRMRGPVFVPNVPFDARLMPVIDLLQDRTIALWEALYDRTRFYVCDRVPFVGNIVYAHVYGRRVPSYPKWEAEIRVVYLRATSEVLRTRPADPLPQNYDKVVAIYDQVIPACAGGGVVIDASQKPIEVIREVLRYACSQELKHACGNRVASTQWDTLPGKPAVPQSSDRTPDAGRDAG